MALIRKVDKQNKFISMFNPKTRFYIRSGLCLKSGIQCYQSGNTIHQPNMTLDNFKKIINEGRTFQIALGGRDDPNHHEQFEDVLKRCKDSNIVLNFTSSGLGFTQPIVNLCKKYCSAVTISWYRSEYTLNAIQ